MKNLALLGLPGVGKSTLLRRLSSSFNFLHLEASELIASQSAWVNYAGSNGRDMSRQRILENQNALVKAFLHRTASVDKLVIIAAHVLLDSREGEVDISPDVFRAMDLSGMYFLHATPENIAYQRVRDSNRVRPKQTVAEIDYKQKRAICTAAHIAHTLKIDLHLIYASAWESLRAALSGT